MLLTDKTSPILELIKGSHQTEDESKGVRQRERERRKRGGGCERGSGEERERALQTDWTRATQLCR